MISATRTSHVSIPHSIDRHNYRSRIIGGGCATRRGGCQGRAGLPRRRGVVFRCKKGLTEEMDTCRVLLSSVATVVLYTALAGCGSDLDRSMAYCRENYSGSTQSECERQFQHRYGGIGHSKASERRPQ